MAQYTDLHTHSVFSDGTLTPTEIVLLAKEKNLSSVALTDHDTVDGTEELLQAGKKYGVEAVSGIELAAYYDFLGKKTEIHIVGLFIDHKNKDLLEATTRIKKQRYERNIKMLEKLTAIGFPMTYDELYEISGCGNCTRAHYAQLMYKKGYTKTVNEAFEKYISLGLPGFVPRKLITPNEAISLIRGAGGIPILAHATLYKLDYDGIRRLVRELKPMGLMGMEVMYSTFRNEQEREITRIAAQEGLLFSGGSDFHGKNKVGIDLGTGKGNLKIPEEFYIKLKQAKENLK